MARLVSFSGNLPASTRDLNDIVASLEQKQEAANAKIAELGVQISQLCEEMIKLSRLVRKNEQAMRTVFENLQREVRGLLNTEKAMDYPVDVVEPSQQLSCDGVIEVHENGGVTV